MNHTPSARVINTLHITKNIKRIRQKFPSRNKEAAWLRPDAPNNETKGGRGELLGHCQYEFVAHWSEFGRDDKGPTAMHTLHPIVEPDVLNTSES